MSEVNKLVSVVVHKEEPMVSVARLEVHLVEGNGVC